MSQKQYDKAMQYFFAAKRCPDKPKNNDIDKLISRCVEKKKAAEKAEKEQAARVEHSRTPPAAEPVKPREPEPPRPLSVNNQIRDFDAMVPPTNFVATYKVAAPGQYTVSADEEWCIIKEQTSGDFKAEFLANPKPRPRKATIEVVCNNEHVTISVEQEANIPAWSAKGVTRSISSPAAETPVLLNYLRSQPKCRVGALTTNRRGVIINGNSNAVYSEETPEAFKSLLSELQSRDVFIDAIALTGSDYYCVVWNGNKWEGKVPEAMMEKLNNYISNGAKILDISISDDGNFTILTDSNVYASRKNDMDLIIDAEDELGMSKNIHITPYGICIVCEYGIVYRNIPANLAEALDNLPFHPEQVIYTDGGTYIISSAAGDCEYNIR